MNDIETGWVAGIIEGEGCFTVKRGRPVVKVEMTDLDVIERLQALTGVGTICAPTKRKDHWSQSYSWQVQNHDDAERLMKSLLPHMSKRRAERIRALTR